MKELTEQLSLRRTGRGTSPSIGSNWLFFVEDDHSTTGATGRKLDPFLSFSCLQMRHQVH